MKRFILFLMLPAVLFVFAQAQMPDFQTEAVTIQIPKQTVGVREDPRAVRGEFYQYQIKGQFFTDELSVKAMVPAVAKRGTNAPPHTPFVLLKTMLQHYKATNIQGIADCYNAVSKPALEALLKNPSQKKSFEQMCQAIEDIKLVFGMEHAGGYYLICRLSLSGGTEALLPYHFVKENGIWKANALKDDSPVTANIAVFLKNKRPKELIKP